MNRLNTELNAVLQDKDLVQRWDGLGIVALGGSPADAQMRNDIETAKWSAVISAANIKLD